MKHSSMIHSITNMAIPGNRRHEGQRGPVLNVLADVDVCDLSKVDQLGQFAWTTCIKGELNAKTTLFVFESIGIVD